MLANERTLIDATALRRWEQQAEQAGLDLMAQAGHAIAHWIRKHYPAPRQLLFAAGPGNNGGDALIAARLLRTDYQVQLWQPQAPQSAPARKALQQYLDCGGTINNTLPLSTDDLLLIDGLFGAGLNRDLDSAWRTWLSQLAALSCPCIALDVPSGLNAWTGCVQGRVLAADHTLSLLCHKPGLYTADGRDYCGHISLLPLDCPAALIPPAQGELLAANFGALQRRHNSNKGSFGTVHIIGGDSGMSGAALLAGRAALALGTGKVRIHTLDTDLKFDPVWPELMIVPLAPHSLLAADEVIAIGPGLGLSQLAQESLGRVLAHPGPLLLDADALNLIAASPVLQQQLSLRAMPAIITPHPAEAARLLGQSTHAIQQDRIKAVRTLAERFNVVALLKGAGSLICGADGYYQLCTAGNAALASAGQGDILSGSIAAFLAQGLSARDATAAAVQLHAQAADDYLASAGGPIGLRASTTLPLMQQGLNQHLAITHTATPLPPNRKPTF